ncbi:hypothetical protein GHK86_04500 [Acidimicrobiaceae bacterium USS-CC1]|uniref:Lamin tail domain-containing protein n=1 Tax=Acidiferrimicrobium australe TaxID=2664430 RepID=A0ABW9QRA5_9ACTN|nr:hypothetical protein [Acidiferrimicrobium australe]
MLTAGAVATGAVWAAPAIESFTSVAAAQSGPAKPHHGTGVSYVTVLLGEGNGDVATVYRLKATLTTQPSAGTPTVAASLEPGFTATDGGCFTGSSPFRVPGSDPTTAVPSSIIQQSGLPSGVAGSFVYQAGQQVFQLTNSSSTPYTLAAWVVHQGQCCAVGEPNLVHPGATTYPGPTSSSGSADPFLLAPNGGTITFPWPSNNMDCS